MKARKIVAEAARRNPHPDLGPSTLSSATNLLEQVMTVVPGNLDVDIVDEGLYFALEVRIPIGPPSKKA